MKADNRYLINSGSGRVSAEFDADGYRYNDKVTLKQTINSTWHFEMSPDEARRIAKALTRAANMLRPPVPRKKKVTS